MKQIIRIKDYIQAFSEKYGRYLDGVLRFAFGMALYMVIIINTGYNKTVSNPFIAVLMSAAAAMLPVSLTTVFACLLVIIEMTSVSLEIAAVSVIFIGVMLLMYYVFRMGDSFLMSASLFFCLFRMPALILPFAMIFPPVKIIPVIFGIVIYGIIIVVRKDFSVLAVRNGSLTLAGRVNLFLSDFFTSERILLVLFSVVLAMLVIRAIRSSRLNNAPLLSMIVGDVLFGIVMIFGNYYLNAGISYVLLAVSLVLNALMSLLIIGFRFNFDYKRTENVQFEDDDYYYYVKAIPKTRIPVTEMRVENISSADTSGHHYDEPEEINTGGVFRNRETDTPAGED